MLIMICLLLELMSAQSPHDRSTLCLRMFRCFTLKCFGYLWYLWLSVARVISTFWLPMQAEMAIFETKLSELLQNQIRRNCGKTANHKKWETFALHIFSSPSDGKNSCQKKPRQNQFPSPNYFEPFFNSLLFLNMYIY